MRALFAGLVGLIVASPELALAQANTQTNTQANAQAETKSQAKRPASGDEVRYFTSIDGLMDGNADVILKENYRGRTVTSAVLDVCYPAARGSDRKDRFVADLAVAGDTLTGTATSQVDKLPVTVNLTRKPTGDTVEFRGRIKVGQTTTNVVSPDNSDLSAQEFRETQGSDESIVEAPRDFTEVSPEAVGVKVTLDHAADFLKSLKGQPVEVSLGSLTVPCEALRRGQMTVSLGIAPERAAAFVAQARSLPGVTRAGWTSGMADMERSVRFPASGWRSGDKLDRDKVSAAIADVLARTLSARLSSARWNDKGRLSLVLKRASDTFPALGLTDTIEINALVAADRPTGSDHLMLWVGSPSITTVDETAGPRLTLTDSSSDDDDNDQSDDYGIVDALAKFFKAQRWDFETSAWK